jgi:uncharacterized protein
MKIERRPEIDRLLGRIIEGLKPERVLIFGSYARGEAGPDSDVDILIIRDSDERPVVRRRKALLLLKGSGVPKDIFILTPREFEESKDLVGTIAYEANHYGKIVYG